MIPFLASRAGRWVRIVAGLALFVGGLMAASPTGSVVAVIGLVPIAAGVFDVCLLAPLFGESFLGKSLRKHRGEPPEAPLFGHPS